MKLELAVGDSQKEQEKERLFSCCTEFVTSISAGSTESSSV